MVARVMDLTGTSGPTLEVASSVPAEFLVSLIKFGMEDSAETFEDGGTWFDEIRTKASPELMRAWAAVSGKAGPAWGNLAGVPLGMALESSGARTVPQFLARVGALPPRDIWLALAGYHLLPLRDEIGTDAFLSAAGGDDSSRRLLHRAARKYEDEVEEAPPLLSMTPEETKDHVLEVMRLWNDEVFSQGAAEVASVLERDAAAKRSIASTTSWQKLIEIATNGIEFRGERWVRRVVLLPHVAMRPWNVFSAWEDTWIICYPAADESLGGEQAAPSARMVRLYKALADDKRLRILKRLAEGQATLQVLADHVGLAKSSAHHHMVILRSAGLVTVTDDLQRLYTLRTDTIPEASGLLHAFLEGGRP
jgi:DNA-binding transcriptional ArsR family regulator